MLRAALLTRGSSACSELQKEEEEKEFNDLDSFPCRSFKSCNSVMNIHFNVILRIQLMTLQRENDPGIKEINI